MSAIWKTLFNLVCAVLVAVATCLTVIMVKDYLSSSWVIGTPVVHDVYEDFNIYEYDLSNELFYQNETKTGFELQKEYPVKNDFDGKTNQYNMLINNKPCTKENTTAGQYQSQYDLSFYDLNGDVIKTLSLYIEIKFYQSRINLRIYNNADETLQGYLREYISYNGFVLRIIEGQYNRQEIISKDYVVYWLDFDSSILQLDFYYRGESLIEPEQPIRNGYVFAGWTPAPVQFVNSNLTYIATYHIDNGNLLTQPVLYDLSTTDAYGLSVSITDSTTFNTYTALPYKLDLQVLYFETKNNNYYDVLKEIELVTDKSITVNGKTISNASTGRYDLDINGMSVTFEFTGMPKVTVDGNGEVVVGNEFNYSTVTIQAFNNISDPNYLYNHIKIQITSVEVTNI